MNVEKEDLSPLQSSDTALRTYPSLGEIFLRAGCVTQGKGKGGGGLPNNFSCNMSLVASYHGLYRKIFAPRMTLLPWSKFSEGSDTEKRKGKRIKTGTSIRQ
jgi:hypothetical protein